MNRTPALCGVIVFFVVFAFPLFLFAATLKAITFSATNTVWARQFKLFTDAVSQGSKDKTRFIIVGGPEAIPPFEQIEAVRRGVVDVALLPAAYFVPQLPEADAMKLSRLSPAEERKKGVFSYYREIMEKRLNVIYLGKIAGGVRYHFYLKKLIKKPDFTGLKIRVTPVYEPFVKALGGVGVITAPGEVYVALERGIVDGFGWPAIGVYEMGWQEVIRFVVDPGFYQTDVCVLVNKATWERLPEGERKFLANTMQKVEKESHDLSMKMAEEERRLLLEKGVRVIEFEGAARTFYIENAYLAGWTRVLERSPDTGKIIKGLMGQ